MKKETFSNSSVVEQQVDLKFIERLENETSLVEFYNMKSEIISRLRGKK
jgi:hypothetical protein